MSGEFQVLGTTEAAPFSLKVHQETKALRKADSTVDPQAWRNLRTPPSDGGETWFDGYYTKAFKIRDRELFA